jgi:hypothetical protein
MVQGGRVEPDRDQAVEVPGDQNLRGGCYILSNRASVLEDAARLIPGLRVTQLPQATVALVVPSPK